MKCILAISVLLITMQANGQYSEWLNSDRPGASMNPYSVGEHILQIQAGYAISRLKYIDGIRLSSGYYPSDTLIETSHQERVKFRFAIGEQAEVNAAINYQTDHKHYNTGDPTTDNYIERIELGLRGCLLKAKGYIPAIGIELRTVFPYFDSDDFGISFSSTLSVQEAFSDHFSLTANVIFIHIREMEFTLSAGYQIAPPVGIFIEFAPHYIFYNYASKKMLFSYLNFGGSWSISRNFQVDLAGSVLANKNDYFQDSDKKLDTFLSLQAGLTARLDWRH